VDIYRPTSDVLNIYVVNFIDDFIAVTLQLQRALFSMCFVSCFCRLDKQTCMPRNAAEIAKACRGKIDFLPRKIVGLT